MPMPAKPAPENKERARKAAELRVAGMSWNNIAKELDWKTESGPRLAVRRYYQEGAREYHDTMHPILQERGELMWRQAHQTILQARREGNMADWERGMRAGDRSLTFLARVNGLLDGPTVNVNVQSSTDVEALRREFFQIEEQENRALGQGDTLEGEVVEDGEQNVP